MYKNHLQMRLYKISAVFICLSLCATPDLSGQEYALPLDTRSPQFSSNFGELRNTRFHAGVDFRTGGAEGIKVFAAADGYISRLCVKPYGYGKGVYITHDDGNTTVYGHLRSFTPEIEKYVNEGHYRKQEHSIDLFPPANRFRVRKGELIGYSGNTGSSSGPHLHFEIRDDRNRVLNVVARGYYKVPDNIAPVIHAVSYYVADTVMGVPFHTLISRHVPERNAAGKYVLDAPVKAPGKGYFTIEVSDRKNGVSFRMGVYRIAMRVDGADRFGYVMDAFTYEQAKYARTVAQYAENLRSPNNVFRLAVQGDGSGLPFYRGVVRRGIIDPSRDRTVDIEVEDDSGNISSVGFDLEYTPYIYPETVSVPTGSVVADRKRDFTHSADGLRVHIPVGALYESIFYFQEKVAEAPVLDSNGSGKVLSDFYRIHTADVPLNGNITISIEAEVPEELRGKVVLARVTGNGTPAKLAAVSARYGDGAVTGSTGSFGVWCVAADIKPPVITPAFKSGADLSAAGSISFGIRDDLAGIGHFRAEIDGNWIILEHDTVKGRLTHYFDDSLYGRGKSHTVTLTVTDCVGNESRFSGKFFR